MPTRPRYWLTRPNWVSSSQTHTMPITVAETTLGVKNRVAGEGRQRPALMDEEREQRGPSTVTPGTMISA